MVSAVLASPTILDIYLYTVVDIPSATSAGIPGVVGVA